MQEIFFFRHSAASWQKGRLLLFFRVFAFFMGKTRFPRVLLREIL